MMILTWLKANLYAAGFFAASAMALALTIALTLANHDRASLRQDVQAADKNLAQCQVDKAGLDASLKTQTAAIGRLQAEGAARTAAAEKALSEARAQSAARLKTIASLRAARPGPDMCASARELIVTTLGAER